MILLALISLNLPQPWPDFPTQLFVYILILFLIGKYVTGNASRARAELGLVLNTCLDIKLSNKNLKYKKLKPTKKPSTKNVTGKL